MKRRAPATHIVALALTLIAVLVAAAIPPLVRTAHADVPPHRLYFPIVRVHPLPSATRTLHVPADYRTIAAALAVARAGDVVQLGAGGFNEWDLRVPEGVTLRGLGWRQSGIWRMRDPADTVNVGRRLAAPAGIGPVGLTLERDAVVEQLTIGADEPTSTGIAVDNVGAHTVRDLMVQQLYFGIWSACHDAPDCTAELSVSHSMFLRCDRAISADANTLLAADHLTIRGGGTGAVIQRPRSRMTNTIFDGANIGIDGGPIVDGANGIVAHHNLFDDVAQPNATWLEPGEGDLVADALFAPRDGWLTPLSPARRAAADGSDIGAVPFAGIGAPPATLRAERGPAPSPGAARPWIVSWDPVPHAYLYHIVAIPADGGPPSLRYNYAEAPGPDDGPNVVGPMRIMDWLEPGRAYRVVVSTAYFERGDSEASEAVLLPAEASD